MASKWRTFLEDYISKQSAIGSVLDIGGSQLPIGKRLQEFLPTKYVIADLPQPHETKQKPDWEFDIQDYFTSLRYADTHKFDYVFCLEVSEYWIDPASAIKSISEFMNRKGTLYISFHWLYPLHNPKGQDCLRYSLNAIRKLLEPYFKIEEINKLYTDASRYYSFVNGEGYRYSKDSTDVNVSGFIIKAIKK